MTDRNVKVNEKVALILPALLRMIKLPNALLPTTTHHPSSSVGMDHHRVDPSEVDRLSKKLRQLFIPFLEFLSLMTCLDHSHVAKHAAAILSAIKMDGFASDPLL